jgi:hypothetical protein
MRGKPNILLQRDGLAHGMDLINPDGPDGKAVNSRIVDFVEQQLPSLEVRMIHGGLRGARAAVPPIAGVSAVAES